ncbi:MAG TPA: hypothetical protein VNG33_18300 [Polyangiaceae bacterium]|nr:hypothetical protein [Polyangiaceae bacterium]
MPAALGALDQMRSWMLRRLGRSGRRYLGDRGARVALYGAVSISGALAFTAAFPLWLLGLGPIVLGVPHLLADVRYLVARQQLHRRAGFWPLMAAPLALMVVYPHACTALVPALGAAILARAGWLRRGIAVALTLGLALLAMAVGRSADLVLAHAHNILAVGLWWAWRRGPVARRWIPLALFAIGVALILGGAFDPIARTALGRFGPGVTLREMVETLSPVGGERWGARFVLFFAFAQSVHYAVWLRLVPEEDRPRPGLRSFAHSFRALRADVGWYVPLLGALLMVALLLGACVNPGVARNAYLQMALFHGPLELAVVCWLLVEKRSLWTA